MLLNFLLEIGIENIVEEGDEVRFFLSFFAFKIEILGQGINR